MSTSWFFAEARWSIWGAREGIKRVSVFSAFIVLFSSFYWTRTAKVLRKRRKNRKEKKNGVSELRKK